VQTPRTFLAVMEGRARAAKQEYELSVSQAWHGEVFARQKKLKKLSEYLPRDEQAEPVSPEVVLDAMLTLQAAGVPMKIVKVEG
jgi:hypothetical protein